MSPNTWTHIKITRFFLYLYVYITTKSRFIQELICKHGYDIKYVVFRKETTYAHKKTSGKG